jgi:putative transposase
MRAIKNESDRQRQLVLQKLFAIPKSIFYRMISKGGEINASDQELSRMIRKIIELHPRYGYRRLKVALKRMFFLNVNHKKVYRIYNELCLQLPQKRRKKNNYRSTAVSSIPDPQYPNHQWSMDFMFDRAENGQQIKILNIIDNYSRKLLLTVGKSSLRACDVSSQLQALFGLHGKPRSIISDNGPEFRAELLSKMLHNSRIEQLFIYPGKPWLNGYIESFNGKYRDEFLNMESFANLIEFNEKALAFTAEYNQNRAHSALKYATPQEVFEKCS